MSFLFPDTPTPPNPLVTSAAQTGTNVSTAIANANLGLVNQNTPQGSLSYTSDPSRTFSWTDPVTNASYSVPGFTATQTLSPSGQATQAQTDATKYNLAALGNQQSQFMQNQFASPLQAGFDAAKYLQQNPDVAQYAAANGLNPAQFASQHYGQFGVGEGRAGGGPQFGNAASLANAPQAQNQFGDVGDPQFGFGAAGDVQGTFGAAPNVQSTFGGPGSAGQEFQNFSGERDRIEQGLMERLNPSLAIERNKYEQQLADQGIRYGSPAYENAMRNYSMQANDARLDVIGKAGQEQKLMSDLQMQEYQAALGRGEFGNKAQQQIFEQARARGQFGNEAQQQYYQQLLGRGTFANAAQQQAFGQEALRGQFGNAALAQNFQQAQSAFNAQNATRQQFLNEQFATRNQPINEISALLSGSQVAQPNFLSTNMPSIPTTDVAGLLNKNFDQQMAATNQQSNNINNIVGGLFGFAGNVARSDRNVKQDITRIGSIMAANPDDGDSSALPIYSYKYKDDPSQKPRIGPMAQDVEKIDKRAVRKIDGVKHIDVPKLGEILRAA